MSSRKQIQAVFFSVIMVMSVIAMGAGGAVGAQSSVSDDVDLEGDLGDVDAIQESTDAETTPDSAESTSAEQDTEDSSLDYSDAPALEEASGETVLLLSVERDLDRGAYLTADRSTLQADSQATLTPVADDVNQLAAANVREQFWVGNIVSVTADLDTHDVEDFAAIDGVKAVAPNIEAQHPAPPEENPAASVDQNGDVTYGLEQIDVPGFEEEFETSGDGTTVSIIDNGISNPEEGHPDLEFATEAIAANGEVTTGTLGSPGAHGEHVAGTATGAAEPEGDVPRFGVAPDADLIKINAFEEGAFTEDLLASVQYSAEQDADVASMSLGFSPIEGNSIVQTVMEDSIQDANAAGTVVIGSAGNEGAGDLGGPTTSPGAEFSGFSVGASNEAGDIAGFSSGDLINERQLAVIDESGDFAAYPDTYPREFVKPDVAAPGADVLSAGPLGEAGAQYSVASGTSMAAPHVAGSVALVQSATEDNLHPKLIESALVETAEKEDNEFAERNNRDIRFGAGIINVTAATQAVQDGTIEVEGEVTDSEGAPITGATVATDDGALTTTDEDGEYTLQTTSESADVTVDEFGYTAETVTVEEDSEVNFQLDDELAVELIEDQEAFAEFGGEFSVTVDVRNLENLTVDLSEETDVTEDDLTLLLGDDELPIGEPVDLDGFDGTATLVVEIDDDADVSEGDLVGLEHTFEGPGDTIMVSTGPTELTAELEGPQFDVDQTVPQLTGDTLVIDEPIDIEAEITNTGDQTGSVEEISLVGGVSYQATNTVTLEPGESTTIVTEFPPLGGFFNVGDRVAVETLVGDDLLNLFEEGEEPNVEALASQSAVFVNEESSVSIDADFIGAVNDDERVTVEGDSLTTSDGFAVNGPITITVDGEPAATAVAEDGQFETELNPRTLDLDPRDDAEVDVAEFEVDQTDEVEIVDEALDLEDGFNLLSVPQPANVTAQDVGALNTWNSSAETYDSVTASEFLSADDLNDGVYVSANNDDARMGFVYQSDVPSPQQAQIESGWNLLGTNYPIDGAESVTLEEDLVGTDLANLDLLTADFLPADGQDEVANYDAYWAFNNADEDEVRGTVNPTYTASEREGILGIEESNFEVADVETSVQPQDSQATPGLESGHEERFLGSGEQFVQVDVTVENTGGADVQFVSLSLDAAQDESFELIDTVGLELEPGETDTVTLGFGTIADDPPAVDVQVTTEDDTSDVETVDLGTGQLDVQDQALTFDDEFVVSTVDFGAAGTVEVVDDDEVVGSATVDTERVDNLVIPIDDAENVSNSVDVRLVDDASGDVQAERTATLDENVIEVFNDAPSFALLNETVDVPVFVDNNALIEQSDTIEFAVAGDTLASEDVTVAGDGFETVVFPADTQALGAEVGDTITHTASAVESGTSDTRTLTIAEATLEFNDQSVGTSDGEPAVLVEDVTADTDQQIVITDTEFNVVGSVSVDERINDENVAVQLDSVSAEDHIAHVVGDDTDVSEEGPGLVNQQATITAANVDIDAIDDVTVESADVPVDVVETVTVNASVVDSVDDRNENFTVEIRDGTSVIGESETINDSTTDLEIELDEPVTAEDDEIVTLDAVLVDQEGAEFQQTVGTAFPSFQTVQDSTTFEIEVVPSAANVALPDQALGAADGADAVFVDDVTASAGQFVAITAADDTSEILGATELDSDVAGEDNVIVELDSEVDAGEYRAHLTSDVGLVGDEDLVTDSGEVYEAELNFEDQDFVGATDELEVATADLLDGADNDTEFVVDVHPTDENNTIIGDEAIGQSNVLTGANEDVTIELEEEISDEDDFVAMLHFGEDVDGPLSTPAIPQVDGDVVASVTDQATITSVESQVTFNDQALDGSEVLLEDVASEEESAVVVTYEDDGNLTVAGLETIDDVDQVGVNDLSITIADDGGFPGDHTAHVIPTGDLSDTEYAPGDQVSNDTAANVTSDDTATVFDVEFAFEDQAFEDDTSEVTIGTASVFDGADNTTDFSVDVVSDDGNVSGSVDLSGENNDVSVALNQSINTTTAFDATLDVGISELEDSATVTIESAEGAELSFDEQAIGTDSEGNDAVLVTDIVEAEQVEQTAGTESVSDPSEDFVVLFEGDEVNADNIVAFEPIANAEDGDLAINLTDTDVSAGNHTVEIHAATDDGDAPDPTQPRDAAATALVQAADLTVNDQTLIDGEDALDEITVEAASLLDGTDAGAEFTVEVESGGELLGNETFTGANSDVTIALEEELDRGTTTVDLTIEQNGTAVEQVDGLMLGPVTDSADVDVQTDQFDISAFSVDGESDTRTIPAGTETVDTSVSITNSGDFDANQDIVLEITDDETGDIETTRVRENVQVFQGETRTISINNVDVSGLERGAYTAEVRSDDDNATVDIVVEDAEFALSSLDPDEVNIDEDTEVGPVNVDVDNVGELTDTQDIELEVIDDATGEVVFNESQEQELASSAGETLTFNVDTTLAPGNYTHVVSSEDDSVQGNITVTELGIEINAIDIDAQGEDAELNEGDGPVDIGVTLENFRDDGVDESDVTLTITGDSEGEVFTTTRENVQVFEGDTRTFTFSDVPTQDFAPDDYDVTVETIDAERTASLTVLEEANFDVTIDDDASDLDVVAGQTAVVNATIENLGDQEDTQDIVFNVSGETEATTQGLTLAGGANETVEFEYTTELADDGANVSVNSDDDSDTRTLTVREAGAGDLTIGADPAESGQENDFTFTFNASELDDDTDLQEVLVDFDDASGVDVDTIVDDDITVAADGAGETGANSLVNESAGQLAFDLDDTFTLQGVDGDVTITINNTNVPNDGTFDGAVEFRDDASVAIAGGQAQYTIVDTTLDASATTPGDNADVNDNQQLIEFTIDTGSSDLDTAETTVSLDDAGATGNNVLDNVAVDANSGVTWDGAETLTIDVSDGEIDHTFAEGDVTATVNAQDTPGNTDTASQTFTVDTTAPEISNPNPADGATVNDASQTYTVDISDATSGVDEDSITVTVNDGDNTDYLTTVGTGDDKVSFADGTLTIDAPDAGYEDGSIDVTVNADDNAGNSATEFTSSFTVDTT